jgi:hypothetical protein
MHVLLSEAEHLASTQCHCGNVACGSVLLLGELAWGLLCQVSTQQSSAAVTRWCMLGYS